MIDSHKKSYISFPDELGVGEALMSMENDSIFVDAHNYRQLIYSFITL